MNICFVTKSDYNVIKNIGRIRELPVELSKLGNKVSLITAIYGNKPEKNVCGSEFQNITFIPIGSKSFLMSFFYAIKLFLFFFFNTGYIKSIDTFIIDYTSVAPLFIFILLSRLRKSGTKYILDIRTIPVDVKGIRDFLAYFEYDMGIKIASLFCSGISVITEDIKCDAMKRALNKKVKMEIWNSGVNLNTFNYKSEPASLSGIINEGDFVLIHHGVLSLNRGIIELAKSMEIVSRQNSKIKLLIIGSGPAYGRLKEIIDISGLSESVYLTGQVPYDKIPGYISLCSAGIIPLPDMDWWRVSSPQKLFEYMAMGKHLIVSDITAHKKVLGNNDFTIYIKNIYPESIANAILEAYGKWSDSDINFDAIKLISSNYTWEIQANKINNFIHSV
ncbi:MAG: glycosyltransferase [Ignavibacteria bacterium]|nr:glycosyltransferase [Ignavibacteria bacterium]